MNNAEAYGILLGDGGNTVLNQSAGTITVESRPSATATAIADGTQIVIGLAVSSDGRRKIAGFGRSLRHPVNLSRLLESSAKQKLIYTSAAGQDDCNRTGRLEIRADGGGYNEDWNSEHCSEHPPDLKSES